MTPASEAERPHLLVIGAGSAGKRHLRNFAQLGCRVSAVDPRADRREEAGQAVRLQGSYAFLDAALGEAGYAGAVICSPPRFHVEQALATIARGIPVYLEKPVSPDLPAAESLRRAVEESGVPLLVGYTYRWWPPLQEFAALVRGGKIGRPLHVKCVMSAHLADWHPWEPYQEFFMASRELGGGALLDESHFVDVLLWLFGMPTEVFARVEKLSALEIETDDTVDAWVALANGLRATIHLDLYGRPHEKYITVTGDEGTLQWSFDPNRIRFAAQPAQEWADTPYTWERNEMFVRAAREFLEVLGAGRTPSCTIADGVAVLRVIEAMRESSTNGRVELL